MKLIIVFFFCLGTATKMDDISAFCNYWQDVPAVYNAYLLKTNCEKAVYGKSDQVNYILI